MGIILLILWFRLIYSFIAPLIAQYIRQYLHWSYNTFLHLSSKNQLSWNVQPKSSHHHFLGLEHLPAVFHTMKSCSEKISVSDARKQFQSCNRRHHWNICPAMPSYKVGTQRRRETKRRSRKSICPHFHIWQRLEIATPLAIGIRNKGTQLLRFYMTEIYPHIEVHFSRSYLDAYVQCIQMQPQIRKKTMEQMQHVCPPRVDISGYKRKLLKMSICPVFVVGQGPICINANIYTISTYVKL